MKKIIIVRYESKRNLPHTQKFMPGNGVLEYYQLSGGIKMDRRGPPSVPQGKGMNWMACVAPGFSNQSTSEAKACLLYTSPSPRDFG